MAWVVKRAYWRLKGGDSYYSIHRCALRRAYEVQRHHTDHSLKRCPQSGECRTYQVCRE